MHRSACLLLIAAFALVPGSNAPRAEQRPPALACTVILDAGTGETLRRDGNCDQRHAPASTFKVPLAVIGYEAGILTGRTEPVWIWKPGIEAPQRDRKPVEPTIWERDSVLWYSREITRRLGRERFVAAMAPLAYGNGDVTGDRGRDNALTHSWLGSSLTISPDEQVAFLRKLLDGKLAVSTKAQDLTRAILPTFAAAGGWRVTGKTGSLWLRDRTGAFDRNRPLGWFVGWAERGTRRIVFARLDIGAGRESAPKGPAVRESFLRDLPALLGR